MSEFQKSFDNYLSTNDREIYSPCEDGHEWKFEFDAAGKYIVCITCRLERDIEENS